MPLRRRPLIAIAVFLVLAAVVAGGQWYEHQRGRLLPALPPVAAKATDVHVSNGADRGPGSLREALFIVAAANGPAHVIFDVNEVRLETALPALVNGHGLRLSGAGAGTAIEARALESGPVLDVSGPDTVLEGLHISGCPGAGVLVRSVRFRLAASSVDGCEVGVEIAGNASDVLIENSHFGNNGIAVRFGAAGRNSAVAGNEFRQDRDAAIWAVRSAPDGHDAQLSVHDNKFIGESTGIVAGNIPVLIEQNEFINAREADVHVVGAGATVRQNHINGGASMGIVAENARNAVIDTNELEGLTAYGVLVRGSFNTLVRNNRLHNCGYGLAFVLGDARAVSTASDNTIIEPKYNGIDVIGDSPILRHNNVLRAHAYALHIEDFEPPGGRRVPAQPFLDNNNFGNSPIHRAGAAEAAPVSTPVR